MTDLDEVEKFREARRNAKYAIVKVSKRTYELVLIQGASLYSGIPTLTGFVIIRGSWEKCFGMLIAQK